MTLRKCSHCNLPRPGATLVEVVAGLTLLASLATGILLAFGAHQKQLRRAEQRLHAVDVADQLLARWYSGSGMIPRGTSGRVVFKQEPWIWRTQSFQRTALGPTLVEKLRVEIYRERNPEIQRPLAYVELFVPMEQP